MLILQQKKVKVKIEWQGNKVLHPPTGSQYITVSKFNSNWENDAWSIVLEFEVPPSKQGNPSYGFAKFLLSNAPQDKLASGSKFELYEGANLVAIVSVR